MLRTSAIFCVAILFGWLTLACSSARRAPQLGQTAEPPLMDRASTAPVWRTSGEKFHPALQRRVSNEAGENALQEHQPECLTRILLNRTACYVPPRATFSPRTVAMSTGLSDPFLYINFTASWGIPSACKPRWGYMGFSTGGKFIDIVEEQEVRIIHDPDLTASVMQITVNKLWKLLSSDIFLDGIHIGTYFSATEIPLDYNANCLYGYVNSVLGFYLTVIEPRIPDCAFAHHSVWPMGTDYASFSFTTEIMLLLHLTDNITYWSTGGYRNGGSYLGDVDVQESYDLSSNITRVITWSFELNVSNTKQRHHFYVDSPQLCDFSQQSALVHLSHAHRVAAFKFHVALEVATTQPHDTLAINLTATRCFGTKNDFANVFSDPVIGFPRLLFLSTLGLAVMSFAAFLYYSGLLLVQVSGWFWRITVIPVWLMFCLSIALLLAKYPYTYMPGDKATDLWPVPIETNQWPNFCGTIHPSDVSNGLRIWFNGGGYSGTSSYTCSGPSVFFCYVTQLLLSLFSFIYSQLALLGALLNFPGEVLLVNYIFTIMAFWKEKQDLKKKENTLGVRRKLKQVIISLVLFVILFAINLLVWIAYVPIVVLWVLGLVVKAIRFLCRRHPPPIQLPQDDEGLDGNQRMRLAAEVARRKDKTFLAHFLSIVAMPSYCKHAVRVAGSFAAPEVRPHTLRLNICGSPASGKTTLKENLSMSIFRRLFNPLATAEYEPTRAIDLCNMAMGPPWLRRTYRIFDMAGQDEFLPSHAFSLGHPHSVYVLVVNLADDDMEFHAKHWLSAISSCHNRRKQGRPPVIFVASHADTVNCFHSPRHLLTNPKATALLQKLRANFGDEFNFIGDPIVMDCRKTICPEVKELKHVLNTVLEETLMVVPDQPGACELIRRFLPQMVHLTRGQILDWPNFLRLVAQQVYEEKAMLSLPREQEEILKKAVEKLEESGELVRFEVGAMIYVVLDIEWILSLVNGRIFCPVIMAGTRPRLNVDPNGITTVHHFKAVFHDTGEEELILQMMLKLELCICFGVEHELLLFPSLMSVDAPPNCWCPPRDENLELVSFGMCLQCCHPVGFSASFFPRLQVRLHSMWMLNYQHEIPMWQGGIKITQHLPQTQQPVEAIIVLANDSFDTHVVLRSHKRDVAAALALRQVILQQIYEVAEEVSQGSQVDQQVLHQCSVEGLSTNDSRRVAVVHFSIPELRQACAENRPATALGRMAFDSAPADAVADLLFPVAATEYMESSGLPHAILLDRVAIDSIDAALAGDDWQELAGHLGFSTPHICRIARQATTSMDRSAVVILLEEWQKRLTADLPELIEALQACHFNRCSEAVEACRHRWEHIQQQIAGNAYYLKLQTADVEEDRHLDYLTSIRNM